MNRIGQLVTFVSLVSVLGSVGIARADDATAAYARGKTALKANKVREACDAFTESEKLRAAVETEVALAGCLEQDGKLLAAAKIYRAAADKDTDAKRMKTSADKATKLEARAPKLRFALSSKPEGLVIKVDSVEVATSGDVMVDLGPHDVIATAPGFTGHANAAVDREGQILDVILRLESTGPSPEATRMPARVPAPEHATAPAATTARAEPAMAAAPEPETGAADAKQRSNRKRNGLLVGGVGVAALVGAGVLFGVGSNLLDDEDGVCPGRPGHICASAADLAKATSYRNDGRMYRGLGIGIGMGGAVLVAVGAILFATAPYETPVALRVDAHGAGVAYTLGF